MHVVRNNNKHLKMTTYISILRGINVSGRNSIKMESLRKMYENLGFHKVSTYIQSGNVIFIDTKLKNEELRKKNLYSNQT